MGEGAGLIREWPLVGEAEGPTGYLVGGTQQTPPPFIFLSLALLRPWRVEEGQGVDKIPLLPPPTWSPEGKRRVEIL